MKRLAAARLDHRGVLAVAGQDARTFLQGLLTNDLNRLTADRALWAALLSPQGRVLFDFGLIEAENTILLDVEHQALAELVRRLSLYRLRAQVAFTDQSATWTVLALPEADAVAHFALEPERGRVRRIGAAIVFVDPRLVELGVRALVPAAMVASWMSEHGLEPVSAERYAEHRIALGVAEGSADLPPGKALPLEANFDVLDVISFTKGCFVGQEVTARMEHRGLVRKRLVPVRFLGSPPPAGATVALEGREVGEIRSVLGARGLALLRSEALGRAHLEVDGTEIAVELPSWLLEELQP